MIALYELVLAGKVSKEYSSYPEKYVEKRQQSTRPIIADMAICVDFRPWRVFLSNVEENRRVDNSLHVKA